MAPGLLAAALKRKRVADAPAKPPALQQKATSTNDPAKREARLKKKARRKQEKIQERFRRPKYQRRTPVPPAAARTKPTSDDEDETLLSALKSAGDDATPYHALIGSFASAPGRLAASLRQRQTEQRGDDESASDEDESDMDEGESGSSSEGEEVDPRQAIARAKLEAMDAAAAAKKQASKAKRSQAAATASEGSGKLAQGSDADPQSDVDGSDDGEMEEGEDEDELDEEESQDQEAAAADQAEPGQAAAGGLVAPSSKRQKQAGKGEEVAVAAGVGKSAATLAAVAPFAGPDPWVVHLCRLLSEEELGSVQARMTGARFTDLDNASHASAWAPGSWQASGSSSTVLPPNVARLEEAGVKKRLQTRWAAVHQEDATAAAVSAAAAAASAAATAESEATPTASTVIAALSKQRNAAENQSTSTTTTSPHPTTTATTAPSTARATTAIVGDFTSIRQQSLFSLLNSYSDILHTSRAYPASLDPADEELDAVLLHCLNHITKSAELIKKNNEALAKGGGKDAGGGLPRDQGFTRPKVLLLLPQRNFAYRAIVRLVRLAMAETRADSVQGKAKFVEQFGDMNPEDEDEMDEREKKRAASKPMEHRALFAGNLDDHFRVGIKITQGAIRLFSDMFQSDIIVASPIGLATKLAEQVKGSSDLDFLSSIEMLVVDRADLMAMQSWSHVETVIDALNKLPKQQHDTDIMRVREWHLSGHARHYRQTIVLSSMATPDINGLFSRLCANHAGALRLKQNHPGVLSTVVHRVQQLFERFPSPNPADSAELRFQLFKRLVWPRIQQGHAAGIMIFVAQYYDFVRLRNFMISEEASFVGLSEYSKPGDATRGRSRFYHGQRRILLYTERAHFFNRYKIRGIRDVLLYGLPEHAYFYPELLNLLEEGSASGGASGTAHATVTALYCKYDALQLERLVGSSRAKKMLSAETSTFMFC